MNFTGRQDQGVAIHQGEPHSHPGHCVGSLPLAQSDLQSQRQHRGEDKREQVVPSPQRPRKAPQRVVQVDLVGGLLGVHDALQ